VLARHFVEVFEPYEAVVTPSGSCAAMVHHWYPRILEGKWAERAEALARLHIRNAKAVVAARMAAETQGHES
jgi:Fe-S oxidoreductase